jgi:cupin superfamily acireductone dioxygenase involved in methionine salvage
MAIVKIIDENRTVTDRQPVAEYLMTCGVRYECWTPAHPVEADSPAEEILKAYASEIESLGGIRDGRCDRCQSSDSGA